MCVWKFSSTSAPCYCAAALYALVVTMMLVNMMTDVSLLVDGANSCHLRCIMATLIHVNTENKKQLDNYNTTRHTQSYCSSLNLMFLSENTELDLCPEKNNRSGKKC